MTFGTFKLYLHYFVIHVEIQGLATQMNQTQSGSSEPGSFDSYAFLGSGAHRFPRAVGLVVVGILHFRVDQGDTYQVLRSGLPGDAGR